MLRLIWGIDFHISQHFELARSLTLPILNTTVGCKTVSVITYLVGSFTEFEISFVIKGGLVGP